MTPTTKSVRLANIRMDGGTQTRAALNEDAVADYADAMQNGAKFPPVVLFYDGSDHWLADGFHRCHASKAAGFLDILAIVHTGTRREAIKVAIQSNHTGSVRRTNADKRKCVEIALAEYPDLSDRALADWCGVGHQMVASVRHRQLDDSSSSTTSETPAEPQTRIGKDGKARKRPKRKPPEPQSESGDDEEQEPEADQEPISPEEPATVIPPYIPDLAVGIAKNAISMLSTIHRKDSLRTEALRMVIQYCETELQKRK